jgi:hypothetical protein
MALLWGLPYQFTGRGEYWYVKPDFVNARDQHAQVVSDDLAQPFVDLVNDRTK